MDKKISKLFLLTTVSVIIIISLGIGLNNKENYEIEDISGNRNVLDNVNLVFQDYKGFYETTEVKISKDNTKVDNYAKEVFKSGRSYVGLSLSKSDKEHRDIIDGIGHKYEMYKNNDSIGKVTIHEEYKSNNKRYLIADIKDKNLKTKKINSYEIPLDYKVSNDSDINYTSASLVYNGDIYVIVGINKDLDYKFGEEANVYVSKESLVNIYKLNLESKKSELVVSKLIGDKDDLVHLTDIFFTYENKFYFIKESYKKTDDNKYKKEFILMSYNLDNKKFDSLNLPIISNDYINYFYVEDDKASFVVYEDSKKSELSLDTTTINLNDNTFIKENEEYNLKFDDDKFNYSIDQVRSIDDKLCIVISAYVNSEDMEDMEGYRKNNAKYLYIIDEKSKEDLYIGKLEVRYNGHIIPKILTNEEI